MPANYDNITTIYDFISRIVYGKSIVKAQVSLLKFIPPKSRLLIVGGGTGWVLEEIAKQHSTDLIIDYVESSAQMIAMSQKRNYGSNVIHFINLPIEQFEPDGLYDVILTPFLFDNFKEDKLEMVFTRLHAALKSKGMWLYADFEPINSNSLFWQKLLLKIMYLFFRITCGIETSELINIQGYFASDFQILFKSHFYADFIQAVAYQKK